MVMVINLCSNLSQIVVIHPRLSRLLEQPPAYRQVLIIVIIIVIIIASDFIKHKQE